ncbi:MAG: glycoside hydrolase family 97 protein [Bacteroidota bacterium]|nr:glycoside hydrolase family 97 protein [Bacteroidota bacterium]MDP4260595.1 glycoside hydrolase family 97 protein [Bacteroidota bacterium]
MNARLRPLAIACLLCSTTCTLVAADKTFHLASPDGQVQVTVTAGSQITYQVSYKGREVTAASALSMTLDNGLTLGRNSAFRQSSVRSVDKEVRPAYGMASTYRDHYNELLLEYKEHFSVLFRAYDNGVAYRFVTAIKERIRVTDEGIEYAFAHDVPASMMKVNDFVNSYEEHYADTSISWLGGGKIAALPLLVKSGGVNVGITESDLLDYAGFYLTASTPVTTSTHALRAVFPKYVIKDSIGGCCPGFDRVPYERANYIAETAGTRYFPWRLMIIAEQDKDLLYNNLVYLLASENKIGDASWVKPGKVAWDWWNANNLTGVPFRTGFNTATYKYYIDFAAANGLEYINMDEGWSDQFNLLKLNDGSVQVNTNSGLGLHSGSKEELTLDMPFLFDYARKKNVGIILWCVWHTLDRQMDTALAQFEKWGVKGLKVDFMDRDDQTVVNFYERLAKAAAARKMLVNFHGAFKPTGLDRAYPNVINREAVQGLEYNKFSNRCTPDHLAHIPFIRMLAGSMDYTPGGLYNVNQADFRVVSSRPMTQGTRCNQLALFTILYAPLEMLSDAPTNYEREPQILHFLAGMPTTWDETLPLDGKIGEYAIVARRKGDAWFVGGISNWTGRSVTVHFDFLGSGTYNAEIFTDGPNANRVGNDYIRSERRIVKGDELRIDMANGGGFAIRLSKVN